MQPGMVILQVCIICVWFSYHIYVNWIIGSLFMRAIEMVAYLYVWENYRIAELPWNSVWTWLFVMMAVDHGYYWVHRCAHGKSSLHSPSLMDIIILQGCLICAILFTFGPHFFLVSFLPVQIGSLAATFPTAINSYRTTSTLSFTLLYFFHCLSPYPG